MRLGRGEAECQHTRCLMTLGALSADVTPRRQTAHSHSPESMFDYCLLAFNISSFENIAPNIFYLFTPR